MANSEFVGKLAKLVNLDPEMAMDKIAGVEISAMIDVIDAVNRGDRTAVEKLLSTNEVAGETSTLDQVGEENEEDEGKYIQANDETEFDVGTMVKVNGKEGSVKIPKGPNGSVGVTIDGKLDMADRANITYLPESILGMTAMADLGRMKALAGIPVEANSQTALGEPVNKASNVQYVTTDMLRAFGDASEVMDKFDEIEGLLPSLRLSDAKLVRDRMNKLWAALNESHRRR